MPRGRHRHSPPLHKILPPSLVAGVSVVGATGAWLLAEPLALRGLVAAVAAAAVTGAWLMRSWDRAAGLRVAELERARAGDAWRAEERIAELEQDLEESRELRTRLETKLRRKRVELAGLRGEHAGLLRRYANAETERASALEGRRRLVIEAEAPRELLPARSTPTPESYRRADEALLNLTRNAALQKARKRDLPASSSRPGARDEDEGPRGKHAAVAGAGGPTAPQHRRPSTAWPAPQPNAPAPVDPSTPNAATPNAATPNAATPNVPTPNGPRPHTPPSAPASAGTPAPATSSSPLTKAPAPQPPSVQPPAPQPPSAQPPAPQPPSAQAPAPQPVASAAPVHVPRTPQAASAVVPYAAARRHLAPRGSFDFFGTQKANTAIESVQNEDLADVVGEEALADHRTGAVPSRVVGKVIDLTAHDETEQFDVAKLRGAVS
ncbi:hypothetical protein [Streptomyces pratensis]|uniref:hypothetical protein n=1 Tax=Streptomyces pratensis TaxID=1169025 RepID=UPI003016C24A